jgi:hypothetical protein
MDVELIHNQVNGFAVGYAKAKVRAQNSNDPSGGTGEIGCAAALVFVVAHAPALAPTRDEYPCV